MNQMFFSETFLLPLVICVLLPGMAGAWWRHSHGDRWPQAATSISINATCEVPGRGVAPSQADHSALSLSGADTNR